MKLTLKGRITDVGTNRDPEVPKSDVLVISIADATTPTAIVSLLVTREQAKEAARNLFQEVTITVEVTP